MKPSIYIILVFMFTSLCNANSHLSDWTFDYFGEEPPGQTMKPFDPCFPNHIGTLHTLIFTPDGNECYFTLKADKKSQLYTRQVENDVWSSIVPVNFPDGGTTIQGFSPNGQRLYFCTGPNEHFDKRGVYVRTRTTQGWSTAKRLPSPVNDENGSKEYAVIDLAISNNEDLYFCTWRKPGKGKCDLWWAQRTNDMFPTTENLRELNTPSSECSVMLSPDNRYLVFYSWRRGGYGKADLYLCTRSPNNTWSPPLNLGPTVNTSEGECPMTFSPDGKYMFFYHHGKPHWISTEAIIGSSCEN